MECHEGLGHVNEVSLKNMANKNIALGMKFPKNPELGICEIYIYILYINARVCLFVCICAIESYISIYKYIIYYLI